MTTHAFSLALALVSICFLISANAEDETIEEVVVYGKRPGPPLKQLSYEGNTLWVFPVINPIPSTFVWDSDSVDFIIAGSDSVLAPPSLTTSTLNPLKIIKALRLYRKARKLPRGQTLANVLNEQQFQKFQTIHTQLGGRSSDYRLRPLFAAEKLYQLALKQRDLKAPRSVTDEILKLAENHDVAVLQSEGDVHINDAIDVLANINPSVETACLTETLASISDNVDAEFVRAFMWAQGEIEEQDELSLAEADQQCFQALFNTDAVRQMKQETEDYWLAQAEAAIKSNDTTFAFLPISEVVLPDGLLNRLRKRIKGS